MTGKDPKDMTASELMRWVKNYTDIVCRACREMGFGCDAAEVGDCEKALDFIADKIDAELAEARKEAVNESKKPMWWFRSAIKLGEDWPEPRDGEKFRDYLHRCFLPRPRFEDGEPVQFGDSPVGLDGVEKFIFTRSCEGSCQMQDADGSMLTVFPGERVKRRAPEVLGADGLPLDEDDTVYGMDREQHRYTVQVPYSINEAVGRRFCVQCYDHDEGNITWCDPSMLTHTPPDTLERLRDDMYRTAEEWREADSVSIPDMNHWADRLTALIERKGGAE